MPDAHPVARYYDGNTRRFLRFGRTGGSGAIHRALWAPGVSTPQEAGGWIHGWVLEQLRAHDVPPDGTLLDLGCGVGATLVELARAFPAAELHGVTISGRQAELARAFVGEALATGRSGSGAPPIRIHRADFEALDLPLEARAAVAIEAFVHSREAGAFFRSAARHLTPGGLLVVVDDCLARPRDDLAPRERRQVRDFEAGWRLGSLGTVEELEEEARSTGFRWVAGFDFTPWIRPGRPRDRVIAGLAPVFRGLGLGRFPFFANMIGGNALQAGLRAGFLRYRGLVFMREAGAGGARGPSCH